MLICEEFSFKKGTPLSSYSILEKTFWHHCPVPDLNVTINIPRGAITVYQVGHLTRLVTLIPPPITIPNMHYILSILKPFHVVAISKFN